MNLQEPPKLIENSEGEALYEEGHLPKRVRGGINDEDINDFSNTIEDLNSALKNI
tara:strand:- start:73 stop:237 length:165 start_codon:yes stop_codon:yes gene_type:complete